MLIGLDVLATWGYFKETKCCPFAEIPLKTHKLLTMKKSLLLVALLMFALGILVTTLFLPNQTPSKWGDLLSAKSKEIIGQATQSNWSGPIVEGGVGDNFTLMQEDKPVSLSDFKGKAVVIYFGYTSCPDVCPTTMGVISSGLKSLDESEIKRVQPIFITLDPVRDKGKALMDYARHFHPNFIGLSGDADKIRKVTSRYRTFYSTVESTSYLGYLIHHTSKAYIISSDQKSVRILPHDMDRAAVAAGIREAL